MFSRSTKTDERPGGGKPAVPRYLAYALPRVRGDSGSPSVEGKGFSLQLEPIQSPASFLDFDGVVNFARAFEALPGPCASDLSRREREFLTSVEKGKTFIFLLSGIMPPDNLRDLAGNVASRLGLNVQSAFMPSSSIESLVPEFRDFIATYGTGYHLLHYAKEIAEEIEPICRDPQGVFGLAVLNRVFFLPCTVPNTNEQALQTAMSAVEAVVAYRKRVSTELPDWTAEFVFDQESVLRSQEDGLRSQMARIESQIDGYVSFKGALVYQSAPLVEVVRKLLDWFFDIALTIDDKCIEDATVRTAEGIIEAVVEIKGVKGSFKREHVEQVKFHRERLGLSASTPGVLIVNTLMRAKSLQEKDEAPHPDIITKAVTDRVLLIRAIDLLRYADCVERHVLPTDSFRSVILAESGWLKVENDSAQVVKK